MKIRTNKELNEAVSDDVVSFQNIERRGQPKDGMKGDEGKKTGELTWKQIILELINSMIPVHLIIPLLFLANLYLPQLLIVLSIFLLFDMEKPREVIKLSGVGFLKMSVLFIPFSIIMDLALVHFISGLPTKE
jgi:hypothetical protein